MTKQKSYCLSSKQIRTLIEGNRPQLKVLEFSELRIQPSSFEPTTSDEGYILSDKNKKAIRPEENKTIRQVINELKLKKINLTKGYTIKKKHNYLIRLNEKISMQKLKYVKSSPKSSFGRLFLNSRMITDFNPCYDEIHQEYEKEKALEMWLFVQPLAFDVIIYPGTTLTQLRFFEGEDYKLTDSEISKEFEKKPMLYIQSNKSLIPAKKIVKDGLQLHLNLTGEETNGLIGFRAKKTSVPIDVKKINHYNIKDFFEPVYANNKKKFVIKRNEHYLMSSKEVLNIPHHLAVEMKSASHIGITGPLHFAGFIDNGFVGDLVFEIRSDEIADSELIDSMPVSRLDVFRTINPDKIYGEQIGSNYQNQIGPKPAKFFKKNIR